MKRKSMKIALLAVGVLLLCASFILTLASMANVNIIGGADWPTFFFIFFKKSGGLHFILALLGVLSIVILLIGCRGIKNNDKKG